MKIIAPFMTTVAAAALLTAGAVAQTPPKDSKTMPQTQSQTPPATPSSPSTALRRRSRRRTSGVGRS
ncbi:MAG: hypothetical protein AB7O46_09350 [Xanthobacteraceae bacterium]